MQLLFSATPPADLDATVRFLTKENRAQTPVAVSPAEFSGGEKSLVFFHGEHGASTLCVGLGVGAKVNAASVRAAAGVAARWLTKRGRKRVAVELPGVGSEFAQAIVEGIMLGTYAFDRFKRNAPGEESDATAPSAGLETLTLLGDPAGTRSAGERGQMLAEAANHARELANSPPNVFFPETLADAARQVAADSHGALEVEVFGEDRLRAEGFGGLLAVGGGSAHGPRLIVLRYAGGEPGEAPVVFVGKTMTFDSGGLSIKPAAGMEEMVWDKCGGCAVLGAMQGVAALKPRRNVIAVLASAENMTGAGAYRPGDVVTVYDGRHVEINNTDAEGRVILADALGYARTVLKPAAMIDLATLTGGCVVALGDDTAGLWSTDETLKVTLLAAAERAGEGVWPMPITREHEEKIKSDIALIKNSSGRPGSPCTAAAFLKNFVGDVPWAHFDIAGPSAITKDRPELARGATGFGTRTLLEWLNGGH